MTTAPTKDQLLLTQHLVEVISRLPADLRGIVWTDHGVTFELSREDYCRQCHVGTERAAITLTYAELLMKDEPQYEGDTDLGWNVCGVDTLMSARWEQALDAMRRARRAKPLSS